MSKVLITGGYGFIGSNLVREIIDQGLWEVDVVDDMSNGHEEFLDGYKDKITTYRMDFSDEIILHLVKSRRYDYVFHLAAAPRVSYSVDHPSETTDINFGRTVKLMEACRGNIKRFIFSSSSSVYGGAKVLPTPEDADKDPVSPYAMQKSMVEDYCKMFSDLYGFDSICLRYFNVFGPRQYGDSPYSTAISAWCQAIKDGNPLRSDWDGLQTRDLAPVWNVVDANILAATHPGKFSGDCFNVACGEKFSNNEILEAFKDKFGILDITHAPKRAGDVRHTLADISKSEKVLAYKPRYKFWEALDLTWEWWGFNKDNE